MAGGIGHQTNAHRRFISRRAMSGASKPYDAANPKTAKAFVSIVRRRVPGGPFYLDGLRRSMRPAHGPGTTHSMHRGVRIDDDREPRDAVISQKEKAR